MKHLHAILISLLFSLSTIAQPMDKLIWNSDTLLVFSTPLELPPGIDSMIPHFFKGNGKEHDAAHWPGYVARWEMIDNYLYLTNILCDSYRQDSAKADLAKLFGGDYKNGKVKANWVTAELLVAKGKLLHYGDSPFFETEIKLALEGGKLTGQKIYDNSKTHRSIFSDKPDSLMNFIYMHIDWKNVPDLSGKKIRVIISVESGATPKPINIRIIRGAENKKLDAEAIRVVKLLPDWDVYYRLGKLFRVAYTIPIQFSEEKRKQYAR